MATNLQDNPIPENIFDLIGEKDDKQPKEALEQPLISNNAGASVDLNPIPVDIFDKIEQEQTISETPFFSVDSFRDMGNSIIQGSARAIKGGAEGFSLIDMATDQGTIPTLDLIDELETQGAQRADIEAQIPELQEIPEGDVKLLNRFPNQNFANNSILQHNKLYTDYLNADFKGRQAIREELGRGLRDRQAAIWGEKFFNETVEKFEIQDPDLFRNRVMNGVGNALTTVAAALLTRGAGGVAIGFGQNGANEYQKALDSGASHEEAILAAEAAGAVGAVTEMLPVGRLIDRVDVATGGTASKMIKNAAKNIVKGGAEEAATEELYTVLTNLIASDVIKYDEERGVFEDTLQDTDVNLTVGGLINGLGYMIGVPMNRIRDPEGFQSRIEADLQAEQDATAAERANRELIEDAEAGEALTDASEAQEAAITRQEALTDAAVAENIDITPQALAGEGSFLEESAAMAQRGFLGGEAQQTVLEGQQRAQADVQNRVSEIFTEASPRFQDGQDLNARVNEASTQLRDLFDQETEKVDALYNAVEEKGDVQIAPTVFEGVVNDIETLAESEMGLDIADTEFDARLRKAIMNVSNTLNKATGVRTANVDPVTGQRTQSPGVPLGIQDIKNMRSALNKVSASKDGKARQTAGAIRNLLDSVIDNNSDNVTGDIEALEAFQEATDNYRQYVQTFKQKESDSIVASLISDKTQREEVTRILGASDTALGPKTDAWLNELKSFGEGPGTIYEAAQGALLKRIENAVLPDARSDADFSHSKIVKSIDRLLGKEGGGEGVLANHVPEGVLNSLQNIRDLSDAMATSDKNIKSEDALAYLSGVERLAAQLQSSSGMIGQLTLSAKFFLARVAAGLLGKKTLFSARQDAIGLGDVSSEAAAIETRRKDLKKRIDRVNKNLKRQQKFGDKAEALTDPEG